MKKLVNDNPETNEESIHNFAYRGEDGNVHLRYVGEKEDVSLASYLNEYGMVKNMCLEKDTTEQEQIENMLCCPGACSDDECPAGLLNLAAIQAAELRERLRQYENTGLEPEEVENLKAELAREKSKLPPCFHACGEADKQNHKCAGIELSGNDMEGCIECKYLYLNAEAEEKQ